MDREKNKKLVAILVNHDDDIYCFRKELMECLIAKGYKVIISCPYGDKLELMKDMDYEYFDTYVDRRGTNPIADLKLMIHYRRILKKSKPDVVLTYSIKPNVYGGMVCSMLGIPYISNITGLGSAIVKGGMMQKITTMLYRIGLKKSSVVFFQNTTNEQFMTGEGIAPGKHRMAPGSGVNLSRHCVEEYPPVEDGVRFLFIGRIMKEKGIDELLAAAETVMLKYPNTQFDLVGEFEEEYQDVIAKYQALGMIQYHGRQTDVHLYIKRSHATVLPSYHEGMSNVLLESASSGRPILASHIAGCKEIFDEGISGLGFEVKNSADLADKLIKFVELPYERKKAMGLAGRKKMETEFDRQIVVEAYLEEIEKICKKTRDEKQHVYI